MTTRPAPTEYAPFYADYVARVPESDVLAALARQRDTMQRLAATVAAAKESYAYEPGKWTVREVVGHLVDGERVFGHRAFCIARRDATPLPAFDENAYVERSPFKTTPVRELVAEFCSLRDAHLAMLRRHDAARWNATGTANGSVVSVRALAYILVGHVRHHFAVLREKYGVACDD
jgi:hypothetical protein